VGGVRERVVEPRGSAVNYLGNPRFHPRIAAKIMDTSEEMEHIKLLLCNRAMVITEDGPMEVRSREEVKDIIYHQFGIRKHELHVFRNYPEPFIAIFSTSHDRDVVYAAARAVEGLIELRFHAWELDRFGERVVIPYHVRLCIEGIPHHAWSKEVADKVLDDEAFIHHVEQETVEKIDQRSFNCWVFCKDPSRLPQIVFLAMAIFEREIAPHDRGFFVRPRAVKHSHVFKVLIHVDAVEDLLFYHYPRDELIADGKIP
jgi:hypothetical protein